MHGSSGKRVCEPRFAQGASMITGFSDELRDGLQKGWMVQRSTSHVDRISLW
jgi:hypothetical protein